MRRDNRAREGSLHATPANTEVFKALGYLTRLQVFFFLMRASREVSLGEIQGGAVRLCTDALLAPGYSASCRAGAKQAAAAPHLLLGEQRANHGPCSVTVIVKASATAEGGKQSLTFVERVRDKTVAPGIDHVRVQQPCLPNASTIRPVGRRTRTRVTCRLERDGYIR